MASLPTAHVLMPTLATYQLMQAFTYMLKIKLKGELTWKIYLCILLPKYVYLFIQCTKNMF